MSPAAHARASYAARLEDYVVELAGGRVERVVPDLAQGSSRDDVERYLDNAVGERIRMLHDDARLVALAFDNIDALIAQYVQGVPRPNYRWGRREASAFLKWLAGRPLDPRQADFVAYSRAEFACLELAHRRQNALRRFAAAIVEPSAALERLQADPHARLCANPVRIWTRLSGRSLGRDDDRRSLVLFAPQGEAICMHALSSHSRAGLQRLTAHGEATLPEWQRACMLSREGAFDLVADWLKKEIVVVA